MVSLFGVSDKSQFRPRNNMSDVRSGVRASDLASLQDLMIKNKMKERANLIIHSLLVWIVFLQQTKELDNVGILFVHSQLCDSRLSKK